MKQFYFFVSMSVVALLLVLVTVNVLSIKNSTQKKKVHTGQVQSSHKIAPSKALPSEKILENLKGDNSAVQLAVTDSLFNSTSHSMLRESFNQDLENYFDSKFAKSFRRREYRKTLVKFMAIDSKKVAFAHEVLIAPKQTRVDFENMQAQARILSIEVLEEAARQGESAPLIKTIQTLSNLRGQTTEANPGLDRDLEDSITAYFKIHGQRATSDLDETLSRLGFSSDLSKQYISGIYFGLRDTFSESEIKNIFVNSIMKDFIS